MRALSRNVFIQGENEKLCR